MTMPVIPCDQRLLDGRMCGAPSLVHGIQYLYRTIGTAGSGTIEHTLAEIQYEIECPNCGRRSQCEACEA